MKEEILQQSLHFLRGIAKLSGPVSCLLKDVVPNLQDFDSKVLLKPSPTSLLQYQLFDTLGLLDYPFHPTQASVPCPPSPVSGEWLTCRVHINLTHQKIYALEPKHVRCAGEKYAIWELKRSQA